MRRVIVHIDSLVLKGFRHEDRHAIADGLQQELARLLGEPAAAELLARAGTVSQVQVGKIHIPQAAGPGRVGVEAARGIAGGTRP